MQGCSSSDISAPQLVLGKPWPQRQRENLAFSLSPDFQNIKLSPQGRNTLLSNTGSYPQHRKNFGGTFFLRFNHSDLLMSYHLFVLSNHRASESSFWPKTFIFTGIFMSKAKNDRAFKALQSFRLMRQARVLTFKYHLRVQKSEDLLQKRPPPKPPSPRESRGGGRRHAETCRKREQEPQGLGARDTKGCERGLP